MIKPAIEMLSFLMENYRKLTGVAFALLLLFPFLMNVYFILDSKGYFKDPRKDEHVILRQIAIQGAKSRESMLGILQENGTFMKDLITVNRGDCLNGAAGRKEMDRCLPPVYKRHRGNDP